MGLSFQNMFGLECRKRKKDRLSVKPTTGQEFTFKYFECKYNSIYMFCSKSYIDIRDIEKYNV